MCYLESDISLRTLFVELPKDYWFVMGEYLPPQYGILKLASYIEQKNKNAEIQVLDSNAESLDWIGLQKRIESFNPDVVASSARSHPFPGTSIFNEAKRKNCIKAWNWANYDMVHAVMPNTSLTKKEVQEELYHCYRSFFGSWRRRVAELFSTKSLKSKLYQYMASQGIVNQVSNLF